MKRTSPTTALSAVLISIFGLLQVQSSSSSALGNTTRSPKIVAISASSSGQFYNVKIGIQHGSRRGNPTISSSRVSTSSKSCIVARSQTSCRITRVKKGSLLTISVETRFKGTASLVGTSVKFRVGNKSWKVSTTTTTTLPSSLKGRSYSIHSPAQAPAQPLPLVLLLHGYGSSGSQQESYMGLRSVADQEKFLLVVPDGTMNSRNERFWNAGPICCDFFNSRVDDEQFLIDLVRYASSKYRVDQRRIYIIGHSNGGAMANRMACRNPEVFAAIASLAGIGQYEVSECKRTSPLGALHIHGTADEEVNFQGGLRYGKPYVGAVQASERWALMNGCSSAVQDSEITIDLVRSLQGVDTRATRWSSCTSGVRTELWTINAGSHVPALVPNFSSLVYAFLSRHAK